MGINSDQKPNPRHLWTTQPSRPGRDINRDQQSLHGAAPYIDRDQQEKIMLGTPVYQQRLATQTPSATAVHRHMCSEASTDECQLQAAKRKLVWTTQGRRSAW